MSRKRRQHSPTYFGRLSPLVIEQIVIPPGPRIMGAMFPARVLVGWLQEPNDIGYLGGDHRASLTHDQVMKFRHLIREGNKAALRLPELDQDGVIAELSPEFAFHAAIWREDPPAQTFIAEGWTVKLVSLENVVALQPLVSLKKCDAMMSAIHPTDCDGLAKLALPISENSYLQVATVNSRHTLRNGYHRAYALLRSGVREAPALVRDFDHLDQLGMPPGIFARVLGLRRPPVLGDFLRPPLAATIK